MQLPATGATPSASQVEPLSVPPPEPLGIIRESIDTLDQSATIQPADARQVPADARQVPASQTAETASEELQLSDVIASCYRSFPLIEQARLERNRAGGELLGAYGAFDTKLQGHTLSEPTGFYRNYRHGLGVARQTWWGGYLSTGWRAGRGDFQPWYKERETNEGGEFKIGLAWPLLQGRAIDAQRVAVFQASLAVQTAQPIVQEAILTNSRDAAFAFWGWVAAGAVLEAQRELLALAETRAGQVEAGVSAGKFPEVDLFVNSQLIAERQGKVIESEQKFRTAGFKLSIYLRDANGRPMQPEDAWLPEFFPIIQSFDNNFEDDLAAALNRRPEPQVIRLEMQRIRLDRQLACNQLLPRVDVLAEASQDVGLPASSKNDKGQFELLVGLQGELPIQRRKARGKIQQAGAKIAQLNEKLRLQQDKIGAELSIAYNQLRQSEQLIETAEAALRAAIDTVARYRVAFIEGKYDLFYLNLLESKVNELEIKLVDAQRNWFIALADMQFALGLDPLDQAMAISELPPSNRPGPAHLPPPNLPQVPPVDQQN